MWIKSFKLNCFIEENYLSASKIEKAEHERDVYWKNVLLEA